MYQLLKPPQQATVCAQYYNTGNLDECCQSKQEKVLQVKSRSDAHGPVMIGMKCVIPETAMASGWQKLDNECGDGDHQTEYESQPPSKSSKGKVASY